jgi:hypothetical protein
MQVGGKSWIAWPGIMELRMRWQDCRPEPMQVMGKMRHLIQHFVIGKHGGGVTRLSSIGRISLTAIIIWQVIYAAEAEPSPSACVRTDAGMFHISDLVVDAEIVQSRRWIEHSTIYLKAQYRIQIVFKGRASPGSMLTVTKRCFDQPIPKELLGYPPVREYCPDGAGLTLTGVNQGNGSAQSSQKRWVLFLKRNLPDVNGPRSWSEVDQTGFADSACFTTLKDLPPGEKEGFRRMTERKKALPK